MGGCAQHCFTKLHRRCCGARAVAVAPIAAAARRPVALRPRRSCSPRARAARARLRASRASNWMTTARRATRSMILVVSRGCSARRPRRGGGPAIRPPPRCMRSARRRAPARPAQSCSRCRYNRHHHRRPHPCPRAEHCCSRLGLGSPRTSLRRASAAHHRSHPALTTRALMTAQMITRLSVSTATRPGSCRSRRSGSRRRRRSSSSSRGSHGRRPGDSRLHRSQRRCLRRSHAQLATLMATRATTIGTVPGAPRGATGLRRP